MSFEVPRFDLGGT